MTSIALDRRAALRARHHAAILAAAQALVDELDGPHFGVDLLAERADVSRRTVFNHFGSLDQVLMAVCTDLLAVIVDEFLATVARTPVAAEDESALFDELAAALHECDLPDAIARVIRVVGPDAASGGADTLSLVAFSRVGHRLLPEVARRHPSGDPLDVELLVGSLMSGVEIIARHWVARTEGRVDAGTRELWTQLLARLVRSLRSGHQPV